MLNKRNCLRITSAIRAPLSCAEASETSVPMIGAMGVSARAGRGSAAASERAAVSDRYRGGANSSLAYRTVHWHKLKPAGQQ